MLELSQRTGPILHDLPEILEKLLELPGIVLGTDINGSVIELFPRDKELGNGVLGELDIGIGIRPFEHIIEGRKVFFDEIGFQIETFALVFHTQEIYTLGLSEHVLLPHAPRREVLAHSLFQIFCFSDIENLPFLVFEKVDSRALGKMSDGGRIEHRQEEK